MKFFSIDGPIYKFMTSLTNVFVISICVWITCIPIVTAGAGIVAAHDVCMKIVDNEEGYVFKQFWQAFSKNLKQGFLLEVITIVCAYAVYLDFAITGSMEGGSFILNCVGVVSLFVFVFALLYSYAQVARYKNKLHLILRNSFRISMKYFVRSLGTVILVILEVAALMWNSMTIIFAFLIGPGCVIYTISATAKKTFIQIEKDQAGE